MAGLGVLALLLTVLPGNESSYVQLCKEAQARRDRLVGGDRSSASALRELASSAPGQLWHAFADAAAAESTDRSHAVQRDGTVAVVVALESAARTEGATGSVNSVRQVLGARCGITLGSMVKT